MLMECGGWRHVSSSSDGSSDEQRGRSMAQESRRNASQRNANPKAAASSKQAEEAAGYAAALPRRHERMMGPNTRRPGDWCGMECNHAGIRGIVRPEPFPTRQLRSEHGNSVGGGTAV